MFFNGLKLIFSSGSKTSADGYMPIGEKSILCVSQVLTQKNLSFSLRRGT